ncbi:unnamed protein product [Haemonchus placei]|uniref:Uncharacterized protein n=1 Tax=Haemonchus placei TaxID=6290 RepID=A0A3P7U9A3_HAEPC|nr:unnamed protein product [Haemonchus placei]
MRKATTFSTTLSKSMWKQRTSMEDSLPSIPSVVCIVISWTTSSQLTRG